MPAPCEAGTYCPEGSSVPITCEAGHYCPQGSSLHIACQAGYYCPEGTVDQQQAQDLCWSDCAGDPGNPYGYSDICTCNGYLRFGCPATGCQWGSGQPYTGPEVWLTTSQPVSGSFHIFFFTYDPIPFVYKKCQCSTPCATTCAPGTYTASGSTACKTCVAGAYSTGTGLTTCAQCSAGTYSTASGATAAAACSNCGAGSFQTGTGPSVWKNVYARSHVVDHRHAGHIDR